MKEENPDWNSKALSRKRLGETQQGLGLMDGPDFVVLVSSFIFIFTRPKKGAQILKFWMIYWHYFSSKNFVSPQHQNQKGSFSNINALVSVILIYITSIYINIYYIDALFYID